VKGLSAVFRREIMSYLNTPAAYVFVGVFLFAINLFAFQVGGLWATRQADLTPFFVFHPWIFMVFLPAVAMRLWAEDARAGTMEVLLTLPATTAALVVGKFLAAWALAGAALALTTPIWITMNVLGQPDNAAIFTAYLASMLMAGAYLAIGSAMSALVNSQVTAFVLAVLASFLITAMGLPFTQSAIASVFGSGIASGIASLSIIHHFEAAQRGVIELRAMVYFLTMIGLFLAWTALAVDARRGG
jgi:ABC-2 type transport system permease protein